MFPKFFAHPATFSIASVLTLPAFLFLPAPTPAQLSQPKLAQIVRKAIRDKTVTVEAPIFREDGPVLSYYFGGLIRAESLPPLNDESPPTTPVPPAWKPLQVPTNAQFVVEGIRLHRRTEVQRAFWEPYLQRVEHIIQKELTLIANSQRSKEVLFKQLTELDAEAERILNSAVAEAARRVGKRAQGIVLGAAGYAIKFTTDPSNGKVYFISVADWEAAKEAGVHDKLETWTAAFKEASMPYGNYILYAKWPGGKAMNPTRVTIDKDRTLVVTPDS